MDEGRRIASCVGMELEIAIVAVEQVTKLLDSPNSPWSYTHCALLRERGEATLAELETMAQRAAKTWQELA